MNAHDTYDALGRRLLLENAQAGKPCLPVLREAARHYGTSADAVFAGALGAALGLLETARRNGICIRSDDPRTQKIIGGSPTAIAIAANRCMEQRDMLGTAEIAAAVGAAVDALLADGRRFEFAEGAPAKAEPLQVAVVAMPTRETVSAIERDENGNIKSSTQVERDAVV